ncbi:MAG: hypothetical protein QM723_19435 [Myxococcaceae bacterium]
MRTGLWAFVIAFVVTFVAGCNCGGNNCSPTTCTAGCCDANGVCQGGTDALACGHAGAACTQCLVGQVCSLGQCASGVGGGSGTGGGSSIGGGSATGGGSSIGGGSATGGGVSTGGGVGTGGGAGTGGGGINVVVFPPSATLSVGESLLMVARVDGTANQTVIWGLDQGVGNVQPRGDGPAYFYASSSGNAVVRVTSAAQGSASATVPIEIDGNGTEFMVVPQGASESSYILATNADQSFAAVDFYSSPSAYAGLDTVSWSVGPRGTIGSDGTMTTPSETGTYVVYAVDPTRNNHVAWSELVLFTSGSAAIKVAPSLASVNAGGSVQLNATVTPSGSVDWHMLTSGGGASVSSTGNFTASVPGVYVVAATLTTDLNRYGVATIVVQ